MTKESSTEQAEDRALFARRAEVSPAPTVPDLEALLLEADAAEARPAFHPEKARWADRLQAWGPAAVLAAGFVGAIVPRGDIHRDVPFREEAASTPSFAYPSSGDEVCSTDEDVGLPVCTLTAGGEMASVAAVTMVSQQDPLGATSTMDSSGCERETSCTPPR